MRYLVEKSTATPWHLQNECSRMFLQDHCFFLVCFSWIITLVAQLRNAVGDSSGTQSRATAWY